MVVEGLGFYRYSYFSSLMIEPSTLDSSIVVVSSFDSSIEYRVCSPKGVVGEGKVHYYQLSDF